MSLNDRLREAAAWINSHGTETITLTIPREALANALSEAADSGRWPSDLNGWVRDLSRATHDLCGQCHAASEVEWDPWGDRDEQQPTHADCRPDYRGPDQKRCACPHPSHRGADHA